MSNSICLILDNIRSIHNVGSIFRTADAAGVSKIYLVGTTPSPVDRFGRKRKDLVKVSLGAEDLVAWEYVADTKATLTLIKDIKKEGFTVVALEQDERSVDYREISQKIKSGATKKNAGVALILGNEVGGVSKELLKSADYIMEIPMAGKKESLNVSVAAGVALFQLNR
ncbi:MAG: TrmH family RNA methyltransferase [Candidatus Pacebacteria bacterium]|nr:TrmH family RNA methyltransferase [Candidatus Paceibacterota bacterium]